MKDVSAGVHYPIPVHRQPAYLEYQNGNNLSFTDQWSHTVLSIPIYPSLEVKNQEYVIEMIKKFYYDRVYESKKIKEAEQEWSRKLI